MVEKCCAQVEEKRIDKLNLQAKGDVVCVAVFLLSQDVVRQTLHESETVGVCVVYIAPPQLGSTLRRAFETMA